MVGFWTPDTSVNLCVDTNGNPTVGCKVIYNTKDNSIPSGQIL